MTKSSCPEHDKLAAVRHKSQAIGEFLEWLQDEKHVELMVRYEREEDDDGEPVYRDSNGFVVPDWPPPHSSSCYDKNYKARMAREKAEGIERRLIRSRAGEILMPNTTRAEALLAQFFDIDLNKLEAEKRVMLEELRKDGR